MTKVEYAELVYQRNLITTINLLREMDIYTYGVLTKHNPKISAYICAGNEVIGTVDKSVNRLDMTAFNITDNIRKGLGLNSTSKVIEQYEMIDSVNLEFIYKWSEMPKMSPKLVEDFMDESKYVGNILPVHIPSFTKLTKEPFYSMHKILRTNSLLISKEYHIDHFEIISQIFKICKQLPTLFNDITWGLFDEENPKMYLEISDRVFIQLINSLQNQRINDFMMEKLNHASIEHDIKQRRKDNDGTELLPHRLLIRVKSSLIEYISKRNIIGDTGISMKRMLTIINALVFYSIGSRTNWKPNLSPIEQYQLELAYTKIAAFLTYTHENLTRVLYGILIMTDEKTLDLGTTNGIIEIDKRLSLYDLNGVLNDSKIDVPKHSTF